MEQVRFRENEEPVAETEVKALDLTGAARLGLLAGLLAVFIAAIGMVESFAGRVLIQPWLTLSYTSLALIPFVFGYQASKAPPPVEGMPTVRSGPRNAIAGALTGLIAGIVISLFVLLASNYNLRDVFVSVSPRMIDILLFDQAITTGVVYLIVAGTALGLLGGIVAILPKDWRQPLVQAIIWTLLIALLQDIFQQVLRNLSLDFVRTFLFDNSGGLTPAGALAIFILAFAISSFTERRQISVSSRYAQLDDRERTRVLYIGIVVLVLVLAVLPQIVGVFVSEVLDLVGIYLLMGLGLNIVVGYAGMLDLGYVGFFAVGAYTTAVLTSPSSPAFSPELTFWTALPFVILAAALAGILVGTPVLRMRGDYLAIVTLGFGEIARLLFVSEWLVPYVGGAQGILSIPDITVGSFEANTPTTIFYPIAAFVLIAVYISWALRNSRIGRAWMAMREDEPVAEVMGIDIVVAKLSAFIIGAIIASFGGAIFATKIGSIFPSSFQILVSITVLVLIIVGGMGSTPGVIVGALVLVGLPELLREFEDYRLLFYGALLIYMMLQRPEGFIPAKERMRELHQEEMMQDAWLRSQEAAERDEPVDAQGRDPDAGLV
jgi:branched-chain amino acid transport system permease protein